MCSLVLACSTALLMNCFALDMNITMTNMMVTMYNNEEKVMITTKIIQMKMNWSLQTHLELTASCSDQTSVILHPSLKTRNLITKSANIRTIWWLQWPSKCSTFGSGLFVGQGRTFPWGTSVALSGIVRTSLSFMLSSFTRSGMCSSSCFRM